MRPAVTGTGCRRAMKSPCSGKPPSCTGTGITDNMHWILLRGLTRERAHWGDFPERLRAAFPDQHFHLVDRSEEHTSELQSRPHLVCRLLLEKKKTNKQPNTRAHRAS